LVNYCKYLAGFCIGDYATKKPTNKRSAFLLQGADSTLIIGFNLAWLF